MTVKKDIKNGRLDVITGPMFAGKSEELVKRLRRFKISGLTVLVFNHLIDTRYATNKIASHSHDQWNAIGLKDPEGILKKVTRKTDVVVIDEVQFFPFSLIKIVDVLLNRGIHVIVAGLDSNFRGEPFDVTASFLALADGDVVKLKAVCAICKKWIATRTQRVLSNGLPAPYKDPLIKVGAEDSYQARCRLHHEVPGKPNL